MAAAGDRAAVPGTGRQRPVGPGRRAAGARWTGGGGLGPGGGGQPDPARWQQAEGRGRSGRVHRRRVALVAAGLVIAGAGVIAAARLTGGTSPPPAPHTNGKACAAGWYNLDGIAGNGCEAHSDYVAGTSLNAGAPVHANLVPASALDSFNTHVSGDALNFCWGALHVTLTAPAQTAERLTVWHGTTKVAVP